MEDHSLHSGLADLDAVIGGFAPGSLTVIAGRPAMGAGSLALTIVRNVALRADAPASVFFASSSLTERALERRMRALETETPLNDISAGERAFSGPLEADVLFRSYARLSVQNYLGAASSLQQDHDFDLLVIDAPQLMASDESAARELKALAMEWEVPVIVTSSVSRSAEKRGGRMSPMLKDLRGPEAIEEAADVAMLLYRSENYGIAVDSDGNSTEGVVELSISKREGTKQTVELAFVPEYAGFENAGGNYS